MKNIILTLFAVIVLVSCNEGDSTTNPPSNNVSKYESNQPIGLLKGNQAPLFRTKDLNANIVELKSYRGNVVLLDFWATWCGSCRQSVPELVKIWEKHRDDSLEIIGVSFDSQRKVLEDYIKEFNMTWIQTHDTEYLVNQFYDIKAFPHAYLLNKRGEIAYTGHPLAVDLEKLVDSLLKVEY